MRPLAGRSESPASSPSVLQRVVTKQRRKLHKNRAHKVTRHRKFNFSLGFGQKYLYESVWGPDEDRHLDLAKVPHFTGKMVNLVSKIDKYQFLYTILLLKILRNIAILFTHLLVKTPQKT